MKLISRAEARNEGLRFFFTGIPCNHDHLTERYVASGSCRECTRLAGKKIYDEKYKTGFSRARPRIDEPPRPQSANAKLQADYRARHANDEAYLEKRREYSRNWRLKNLERSKEISRESARRKKEREAV